MARVMRTRGDVWTLAVGPAVEAPSPQPLHSGATVVPGTVVLRSHSPFSGTVACRAVAVVVVRGDMLAARLWAGMEKYTARKYAENEAPMGPHDAVRVDAIKLHLHP